MNEAAIFSKKGLYFVEDIILTLLVQLTEHVLNKVTGVAHFMQISLVCCFNRVTIFFPRTFSYAFLLSITIVVIILTLLDTWQLPIHFQCDIL